MIRSSIRARTAGAAPVRRFSAVNGFGPVRRLFSVRFWFIFLFVLSGWDGFFFSPARIGRILPVLRQERAQQGRGFPQDRLQEVLCPDLVLSPLPGQSQGPFHVLALHLRLKICAVFDLVAQQEAQDPCLNPARAENRPDGSDVLVDLLQLLRRQAEGVARPELRELQKAQKPVFNASGFTVQMFCLCFGPEAGKLHGIR